jgi:parvulin-like peptidyl-prolyl isomerase
VEPFALFDESEPKDEAAKKKDKPADFLAIKNAAASLHPGEVSEFFPWEEGGLVVYLEKKEPPDQSKYQQEKSDFENRMLNNKRQIVFAEWLRERQNEAGAAQERAEQRPPPPRRS